MTLKPIGILLASLAVLVAPVSAVTIYAGDFDTDDVSAVDPANANTLFVGNMGENLSFGGFAYDTSTGTMYASDVALPEEGGGFALARINLTTGAATIIGSHVNSINIWGLAYDSRNNVLYGADGSNDGLATINRATGVSTLIGPYDPQNQVLICALAYDAGSDTLYGVTPFGEQPEAQRAAHGNGASGAAPAGNGSFAQLYRLDRATGAATLVGDLGVTLDPDDVRCGLEMNPATNDLIAGAYDGSLYRVDKLSGAAILIGNTGVAIDALGSPPAGTLVDVPALSVVGLAIFALALITLAALTLRRRAA